MMERSTLWFHRPAANRWNLDVPSAHGNTAGADPACPATVSPPPLINGSGDLKNPGSAPAPADQQTLPVSQRCVWNGKSTREPGQGKGKGELNCLPNPPCTMNPLSTRSCRDAVPCTAGHSSAPWGLQLFVNGADSEPWTWQKAELIFTQRKLMGWCPAPKHSPSAKS